MGKAHLEMRSLTRPPAAYARALELEPANVAARPASTAPARRRPEARSDSEAAATTSPAAHADRHAALAVVVHEQVDAQRRRRRAPGGAGDAAGQGLVLVLAGVAGGGLVQRPSMAMR
jgi:hypothetical protein